MTSQQYNDRNIHVPKVKLAQTGIFWSWRHGVYPVYPLDDAHLQICHEAPQAEFGGSAASLGTRAIPQLSVPHSSEKPLRVLSWDLESQQKDLLRMTDPMPWNANPAQFMVHNYIQ